jgi:hypothetical protein
MQYITQAEAAVYSVTIGALTESVANAYLTVASEAVDFYCGRTFDTVLDTLPAGVAMAVALWAEDFTSGTSAGKEAIEKKIGDYMIKYADGATQGGFRNPCPDVVAVLLSPYRRFPVG